MVKAYLFFALLFTIGLFWIALDLHNQGQINAKMLAIEEKSLSIEEEKHIDNLYSIYQENMNICKQNALEQKKDNEYIKENCINVINNSIIANWLKERGYGDLIKEE